jgi:predicted RecB family endonuclease
MLSEKQIEDILTKDLLESQCYDFALNQVYVAGKRIDIVLKIDNELIAIEVKIKDWKTALRQANLNQFAVDKSYVAICSRYAMPAINNISLFANNGVGLMVVSSDNSYKIILPPRRTNDAISINYKKGLLSSLSLSMA